MEWQNNDDATAYYYQDSLTWKIEFKQSAGDYSVAVNFTCNDDDYINNNEYYETIDTLFLNTLANDDRSPKIIFADHTDIDSNMYFVNIDVCHSINNQHGSSTNSSEFNFDFILDNESLLVTIIIAIIGFILWSISQLFAIVKMKIM